MIKKGIFIGLGLLVSSSVFAGKCSTWDYGKWWNLQQISNVPSNPMLGETIRMKFRVLPNGAKIPNQMSNTAFSFANITGTQYTWEYAGGVCPSLPSGRFSLRSGQHCDFNIVIPIKNFQNKGGSVTSRLEGRWDVSGCIFNKVHKWNHIQTLPQFQITNIRPRPLSFRQVGALKAVAGQPFTQNINSLISNLNETHDYEVANKIALKNSSISISMVAGKQGDNGLRLVKQANVNGTELNFALIGNAKHAGTYTYKIKANNFKSNSANNSKPYTITVKVGSDPAAHPEIKDNATLETVNVKQGFSIDLMSLLIKPEQELAKPYNKIQANSLAFANPVQFHLVDEQYMPDGIKDLAIVNNNLQGKAKIGYEGSLQTLLLYAQSNLGGKSDKVSVTLPIAQDQNLRPVVKDFEKEVNADINIRLDLKPFIKDKTNDSAMTLTIDSTEPLASWLTVNNSQLSIGGTVPSALVGETLKLTWHATNVRGGQSKQATAKIKVDIDSLRTPVFKVTSLPDMYSGQSYSYDFVKNQAISPAYNDYPYQIEFAKGQVIPAWLKLENNVLTANNVPKYLRYPEDVYVFLVAKNKPGGISKTHKYIIEILS